MKRTPVALALVILTLTISSLFGLLDRSSVIAGNQINWSGGSVLSVPSSISQSPGIMLPNTNIYGLTTDNTIYLLTPGTTRFTRLVHLTNIDGTLIGLDFRPADGSATSVYGLTNTGKIYLINLAFNQLGATTLVSALTPRFAGGFQSLMDFNPVVNALRIIGSNDQNFAVVNANSGNLNQTSVQTALAYAKGDVNAGVDPNITAGAYTNNFVGAANTLFYIIDYDLGTFATISTRNATGSSNTGGGQLQTIGSIVDITGNPINIAPTAGFDIYTDANRVNSLIGVSGQMMFTIDLTQINQSLSLGTTQNVVARSVTMAPPSGDIPPTGVFIDIAVSPFPTAPTPTPTPTSTPTPPISALPITPVVECVSRTGNSGFIALFGYFNPNPNPVTIPVGSDNGFTPAPQDRLQTMSFLPGRQRNVFTVSNGGGVLTWNLNGRTATASLTQSSRCNIPASLHSRLLQLRQTNRSITFSSVSRR
jgi:hypothetical protein